MPEKSLTIATYAAGASLAAITLVYVFGPTFFIDGDSSTASSGTRKRGIVGLTNPANDCFINSILQALAGLGELRIYLIRESHRRRLDGREIYKILPEELAGIKKIDALKLEGVRRGIVTQSLKEVLDSLNERPIYKKTISAADFVADLEYAFQQRISRQQQDAQEFLQVVAERLCDEYHAGKKAREKAAQRHSSPSSGSQTSMNNETMEIRDKEPGRLELSDRTDQLGSNAPSSGSLEAGKMLEEKGVADEEKEVEEGFPFEGTHESFVECLTCHFKPRPSVSAFVTLTLSVPQTSSTSLNSCFDGFFKTEYIEDYRCDWCRLEHALQLRSSELSAEKDSRKKAMIESEIVKLRHALEVDAETPPSDVTLPDLKLAPKRKIARHVRITKFPKILAIHLSRSIFDPRSYSTKNSARVSFPERLPLGGMLDQKQYKLLGVVTHKGSHHSGHYESFRRQNLYPPFSTPNTFKQSRPYSRTGTPSPSVIASPNIPVAKAIVGEHIEKPILALSPAPSPSTDESGISPVPSLSPLSPASTRPSSESTSENPNFNHSKFRPTSAPREQPSNVTSRLSTPLSKTASSRTENVAEKDQSILDVTRFKRKKKPNDRWWRISDDKIKESKTSDVLGMQKEVYLLFYEMER